MKLRWEVSEVCGGAPGNRRPYRGEILTGVAMDTSDIIKLGITVGSGIIALWQIKARFNIQRILRQESFNLHSSVALVLGNCQVARDQIINNQIPNAIATAGQAEGGTQMLLKQTVKLICHYHNPTDADIDEWIGRGKINQQYKPMFLSHSEKNRGWLRSIYHIVKKKLFGFLTT